MNEHSNLVNTIQKNIVKNFETKAKQKNIVYKISPLKLKKKTVRNLSEWTTMANNNINKYRTNRVKNIDISKKNAVTNNTDLPNKSNLTFKNDNFLNKNKNKSIKLGDNMNKMKGHKKTLSVNFDLNVDKLIDANGTKEIKLKK